LEQCLDAKKLKVKQRTLENYTWLVEKHIIPVLGNIPIGKLTADRIEAFYGELVEKNTLASENISKIHTLIHESLNRAMRRELINKNAAALVDRPRIAKTLITVWDKQQSQAFLHAAREHRFFVAFILVLTTGIRLSEILGLRWQDVDLDASELSVVQALSHDGKELSELKTASSGRKIVLPSETVVAMRKRKGQAREEAFALGRTLKPSDLVISTSLGTKVIPRNLVRTFYQLLAKVDVPRIRFHDLRHTHATLLLKANINPKIVAERLGHANVRVEVQDKEPVITEKPLQHKGSRVFN